MCKGRGQEKQVVRRSFGQEQLQCYLCRNGCGDEDVALG